jgi:uncharacterized membrane protein YvlD (DUF360 family)
VTRDGGAAGAGPAGGAAGAGGPGGAAGSDPARPGPRARNGRRRGPWRWLGRSLLVWLLNTASLIVLARFLPGLAVRSVATAALATAAIGLLNAVLWPLLMRVLLPVVVYTLGFAALLLNGAVVWAVGQAVEGVTVAGFGTAVAVAVALTAVSSWMSSLLAIDDDESYYRAVVLRLAGRPSPAPSDAPAVLFLEIDGLAYPILLRAIRNGHMPTLARWLRAGSHRLLRWRCDLSSQTAASQSGILLGNNFDVPAFRWYEKDTGRTVVTSSPESAAELERRLSDGHGLLAGAGASRGNVFSGDAPQVLLTLSTIRDRTRFHADGFTPFFARAYGFTRLLILFVAELVEEWVEARRQRRRDIYPRISRGWPYPVLRAFTTVVLGEITLYTLIGDMFAGVPVAYATFSGYDEVAHHSGPEREDAIKELEVIDRQFARLEDAAALAPRPYHFVVLSDHGQSQGATFLQRYGVTLRGLVDQLTEGEVNVESPPHTDKAWGYLDAALAESAGAAGRAPARLLHRAVERGAAAARDAPAEGAPPAAPPPAGRPPADVVVMASGNLGLIYFSGRNGASAGDGGGGAGASPEAPPARPGGAAPAGPPGRAGPRRGCDPDAPETRPGQESPAPAGPVRMTLEQIEAACPALIRGLAAHPGIGFVLVHSAGRGPVVVGAAGIHYLEDGHVEGQSPLRPFGPNAVRHLRHAAAFPHAPDILVNSLYDRQHDEVAAFEELIGSHGGLGGDQDSPFVLFPATWPLPLDVEGGQPGRAGQEEPAEIVGAVALHHVLKGWLRHLGLAPEPALVDAAGDAAAAGEAASAPAGASGGPVVAVSDGSAGRPERPAPPGRP